MTGTRTFKSLRLARGAFVQTLLAASVVMQFAAACGPQTKDDAPESKNPVGSPTDSGENNDSRTPGKRPGGFPQDMGTGGGGDLVFGATATISNLPEMIEKLNLAPYHARGFRGQNLKIAVFDNGFAGLEHSLGTRLPPDSELVTATGNETQSTSHGTKLAELVYGLAAGTSRYDVRQVGPQIVLFNTNGYSNLVEAIDQAIARRVDMILYAQVWEYGGNFNGAGFINAQVRRATEAGILWVNAAGNFGQSSFVSSVHVSRGHAVDLPFKANDATGTPSSVRLRVPEFGGGQKVPVRIVLSWNDFSDSKLYRTPQDLDLVITDAGGRELAAGRMIQDGKDHGADGRYSAHARELIRLNLSPGIYHLRVQAMSDNFDDESLLRIAADGAGVQILDNPALESILIPADNPAVLTVGAIDVDYSAKNSSGKPELRTISRLMFDDGQEIAGTSAASAVAVGTLAVMQSVLGKADRQKILDHAGSGMFNHFMRLTDPERLVE